MVRRNVRLWLLGSIAILGFPSEAPAIELEATTFKVGWTPATGTLAGYEVWVSRNGSEFIEESKVDGTEATLIGQTGEVLVIKVRAYRDSYAGPFSPVSEAIALVAGSPGEIEVKCVDSTKTLVQTPRGTFRCE